MKRYAVPSLLLFAATCVLQAGDIDPNWLEGSAEKRAKLSELEHAETPPALQVTEWINSGELKLEDLKGKVVVVDFWATWCGPCIASIPKNNALAEKYKEQGLVFIGVCHSRGSEKMAQVVADKGMAYPTAADVGGKTVESYAVNSFPDYYIFDKTGKLRIADCKNSSVEAAVKMLLAE